MMILSQYNSYHTPGIEDQVFAPKTDLPHCHGHQVLLYQGIPAVQTVPVGAGQ